MHRRKSNNKGFTANNVPHPKNSVDRLIRRGGVRL